MAMSKTCRCGKIIDYSEGGYCEECKKIVEEHRKARRNLYDKTDRAKETSKVYKNKQWKYTREAIKIRQSGLCLCCKKLKKVKAIDHIHHIVTTEEDKTLWYELGNLVGVCEQCHKLIHSHYGNSKDKEKMQEYLRGLIKEDI